MRYDVAVIGAGIAGLATAARLQAAGLSTIIFEAHGQPGGCAGFFRRKGFSFDVGATTLVDFEPGGVGAELLDTIGMPQIAGETQSAYVAWLPDRKVILHRDPRLWNDERLQKVGDSSAHRRFWRLVDGLADCFWAASRRGVKLPIRTAADVVRAIRSIGPTHVPAARYLSWTMGDALRSFGLRSDIPLVGLLAMMIEDTVHSSIDDAPLVNSALGISIRAAGLTRPTGGMRGFIQAIARRYRELGGRPIVGNRVENVVGAFGDYTIESRRGAFGAKQVVSAIPAELTTRIAPQTGARLKPFLDRDRESIGSAVVVFLGVPEEEVAGQELTHHQLMQDYAAPLGEGNNMFVSVSARGDTESAPSGFRAVMVSTHCSIAAWKNIDPADYETRKHELGQRLIKYARRVYPNLATRAIVHEVATPRTYERFTSRPDGAVGGFRQALRNTNQHAIPHDVGIPGFWLAGDSTWPGLGTVACVLGSRIVAEGVLKQHRKLATRSRRRDEAGQLATASSQ